MRNTGEGIFELLKNEDFVLWVANPTEEATHYWSKWIASNPGRVKDVELARQFILSSQKRIVEKMPEEGYDHVLEKIVTHSRIKKSTNGKFSIWRPLGIAAAVTLAITAAIFALWNRSSEADSDVITKIHKEAPSGTKVTTRLPDGSMVTLNSGSTITFPESFKGSSREVSLSGEAFFEVERNPKKPFYVIMKEDKVRVLGTSFNIRSYSNDSVVSVAVASGRVSYTSPYGQEVILSTNEMASFSSYDSTLTMSSVDWLQSFGWKDKIIYFKSITFESLTKELERWYGVKIIANDNFGVRGTYSGKFDNPTLSEILHSLSFVYRFKFEIEGNKVILNKITNQKN